MNRGKIFRLVRLTVAVLVAVVLFMIVFPELAAHPSRTGPNGHVFPATPAQPLAMAFYIALFAMPVTLVFLGSRGKIWLEIYGWLMLIMLFFMSS